MYHGGSDESGIHKGLSNNMANEELAEVAIAESAHNAYKSVLEELGHEGGACTGCVPGKPFAMLSPAWTNGWVGLARHAIVNIEKYNGLTMKSISNIMMQKWRKSSGVMENDVVIAMEDLPLEARLAWEAAARHLAYCCCASEDEEFDMAVMEAMWPSWSRKRMEKEKNEQQQR